MDAYQLVSIKPPSSPQISTYNLSDAAFAPQQFSIGFGITLIVSAIRTLLDALPSTDSLMLGPHSEVMSLNFHDQASSTNCYSCESSGQYYSIQHRDNS